MQELANTNVNMEECTHIISKSLKLTLYFMSWHLTPTTAWCPTKLLHPNTVWPGRSSPTTAPLLDKVTHVITERLNNTKNASQKYINFQTHVIKMQCSPNVVFPNTWLPGYSRQPFPSFAEDPTVQKGPIETPWTTYTRSPTTNHYASQANQADHSNLKSY